MPELREELLRRRHGGLRNPAPSWIGDRIHAVITRLHRNYHISPPPRRSDSACTRCNGPAGPALRPTRRSITGCAIWPDHPHRTPAIIGVSDDVRSASVAAGGLLVPHGEQFIDH